MRLIELPNKLLNQPFTYKMAQEHGIKKNVLARLLRESKVEKIYRGIYASSQLDRGQEFEFRCASLSFSEDSIVCLMSALIYYELADLIGRKVWLMVPNNVRTKRKWLKITRSRNLDIHTGVKQKKGFKITSIERTIVDAFIYKKKIGLKVASNAYKQATQSKATTALKVLEMAKKLKVEDKIKSYIEIM